MMQELDPDKAVMKSPLAGGLGGWSWRVVLAGGLGWWCAGFYLLSALLVSFTLMGEAVDAKLASCRGDKDRKPGR